MTPFISVVIPVYNSEKSLFELYSRLVRALSDINWDFEIIMVDDNSSDDSVSVMKRIKEQDDRLKVISLKYNAGQNNAAFCGLQHSSGQYIITLDDDLQHPPEEIIRLYQALENGNDVVFGIPLKRQQSFYRNLGSELVNICLTIITNKQFKIRASSYRMLKQDIAATVTAEPPAFIYLSALILQHTTRIGNSYIKHDKRKYGKSNYNLSKTANLVFKLMVHYSYIPVIAVIALWAVLVFLLSILPLPFIITAAGLCLIVSSYVLREYWRRYTNNPITPCIIKEKLF